MAVIKAPTGEESRKIYEPYAIAMGELVYAWNHLQEELAHLFWRVTGIPNGAIPFAIWHSTPSDLSQRKMLRAATDIALANNEAAKNEIIWLLDKVDHSLSSKRNDAIHAPLILFTDGSGTTVAPYDFANSPRADSLQGKEILKELIWYRETAEVLRRYCWELRHALKPSAPQALPKRPTLPDLGPQTISTGKHPAKPRKGHQPPHRLSIHEA